MFFVITANPAAGIEASVDFNVAVLVFKQIFGVTTQAGIVKFVNSVTKYITSL